jgi:hypothetical protein
MALLHNDLQQGVFCASQAFAIEGFLDLQEHSSRRHIIADI